MRVFFSQCEQESGGVKARSILGLVTACTIAVAAGAAGFWYGQLFTAAKSPTSGTVAAIGLMLQREREAVDQAQRESNSHFDALGGRLAQMQADLLRLNALGGRLVNMAGLSEEEFDFENPPPMGGPEPSSGAQTTAAELTEEIDDLFSELQDRDRKLTLLEQIIMERDLEKQSVPAGSPTRSGYVTSKFGYRRDPINRKGSFHRGVDFAGKRGSPIVAVADGLVILAERRSGYGRTVEINHGNGLVTRYAHAQKLLVKKGDVVKQGKVIATVGSSGRSTGPHLHFEVIEDGTHVDPMKYVGLKKRNFEG
mgnify:CR=1 FL=1